MSWMAQGGEMWLLRVVVAGGGILLLGWLYSAFQKQPARRQRIAELALGTSLLIAGLALLPGWWSLDQLWGRNQSHTAVEVHELTASVSLEPRQDAEQALAMAWLVALDVRPEWANTAAQPQNDAMLPQIIPLPNRPAPPPTLSAGQAILATYVLVAAVFLGRFLIGLVGLVRLRRQSRPATPALQRLLDRVLPTGQPRPMLRVHERVKSPISFALPAPTILVPVEFEHATEPHVQASVLAHELMHLSRRDFWSSVLLGLSQVIYFVVPWFWVLRHWIRLAQEYVADAAATRVLPALDYAQVLVDLSARSQRLSLAQARANGVFQSPSDLSRRVAMLLRDERAEVDRFCPRWWSIGTAALFIGLATVAGGLRLHAAEPPAAPTAKPIVLGDAELVYLSGDPVVVLADEPDEPKKEEKTEQRVVIRRVGPPLGDAQKEKLEAARKRIQQTLEKLGDRLDGETRKALEEAAKQLEELQRQLDVKALTGRVEVEAPFALQWMRQAGDPEALRRKAEAAKVEAEAAKARLDEMRQRIEKVMKELGDDESNAELRRKLLEEAEKKYRDALDKAKELSQSPQAKLYLERLRNSGEAWTFSPTVTARATASLTRPRLGIHVEAVPPALASHLKLPEKTGLMVTEVVKDSSAEKAGFRQHDIIIAMAGQPVSDDVEAFRKAVSELKAETKVDFRVVREGKKVDIQGVEIAAATESGQPEFQQYFDRVTLAPVRQGDTIRMIPVLEPSKEALFLRRATAPLPTETVTADVVLAKEDADQLQLNFVLADGPLQITVTASAKDGEFKVKTVQVVDGDDKHIWNSVENVSAKYQKRVKQIVEQLSRTAKQKPKE